MSRKSKESQVLVTEKILELSQEMKHESSRLPLSFSFQLCLSACLFVRPYMRYTFGLSVFLSVFLSLSVCSSSRLRTTYKLNSNCPVRENYDKFSIQCIFSEHISNCEWKSQTAQGQLFLVSGIACVI